MDELIDFQQYPVGAAEVATKARRSLGIGYIGLAHYLAKQGVSYGDPEAWKLVHDLTEAFQYYLIKSTVNLAKEKGACQYSCLLYTSPSPRDVEESRMPSSA